MGRGEAGGCPGGLHDLCGDRFGRGAGKIGQHAGVGIGGQDDARVAEHGLDRFQVGAAGQGEGAQGNKLKAAGADFFLLACNTVHAASDHIEKAVDLPFLHIVDPAARRVMAGGFQTVGLLGSRYTMTGSYFTSRLQQRYDLSVLVAEGAHRDNVHHALYDELAKGSFLPATRAKFQAAITDLVTRGAEVIILACTEFGMLVEPEDSPVPIIDTATAHAEAAVDIALASD